MAKGTKGRKNHRLKAKMTAAAMTPKFQVSLERATRSPPRNVQRQVLLRDADRLGRRAYLARIPPSLAMKSKRDIADDGKLEELEAQARMVNQIILHHDVPRSPKELG